MSHLLRRYPCHAALAIRRAVFQRDSPPVVRHVCTRLCTWLVYGAFVWPKGTSGSIFEVRSWLTGREQLYPCGEFSPGWFLNPFWRRRVPGHLYSANWNLSISPLLSFVSGWSCFMRRGIAKWIRIGEIFRIKVFDLALAYNIVRYIYLSNLLSLLWKCVCFYKNKVFKSCLSRIFNAYF